MHVFILFGWGNTSTVPKGNGERAFPTDILVHIRDAHLFFLLCLLVLYGFRVLLPPCHAAGATSPRTAAKDAGRCT